MPNVIKLKNSGTAASVPSSLELGELALNYADGRLFYRNPAGTIVTFTGGGVANVSDGDKGDIVVTNGGTTWSLDTGVVSSFARTLLDDADAATARTTLGAAATSHSHTSAAITDFNSAVAAASPEEVVEFLTAADFPATGNSSLLYLATDHSRAYRWTGSQYAEVGPSSVFYVAHSHASSEISDSTAVGRALLTAASASDQRTSLGLGTMATETAANYLARSGGTMTGQLLTTAGSASAPAIAISGDTNCGIAQLGGVDTLGVVTAGVERVRVGSDSSLSVTAVGDTNNTLRPAAVIRAWVSFNAGATPPTVWRSFNVTSVARLSGGVFNISLLTALSSNGGAAVASGVSSATLFDLGHWNNMANAVVINSTLVRVGCVDIGNVFQEQAHTSVIVCDL